MVEIDSQECSPHFLTQDSFYDALKSAPNLFFIDVDIGEIEISDNLEANIKGQLTKLKNPIIIQCKSSSNTMDYVNEPNKEPIILDLIKIRSLDKEKINEILREAINYEKYKIYAYLQSKGITFNDGQEQTEIFKKLKNSQKEELQKEIDYYFVPIEDAHILVLVSKTKAAFHMTDEFKEKVEKWYRKLDEIDEISAILKVIAVRYSGLGEIVFDEERENVRCMCVYGDDTTRGITNSDGRIKVGAKREECELLGTLAHELTHFAMKILYRNNWNPYDISDNGENFEQIAKKFYTKEKGFANTKLESIIENAYKNYPEEEWHSELIVRIPHILAKYGKKEGIALLQTQAKDLLNYYNETIIPRCNTFVQESHVIQPRNDIKLLNQYLNVIDTIKKCGVELKDPIEINSFLSKKKQENDFKNYLLIRTKNTLLTSCGVHQSLRKIPEYSKENNFLFLKLDQYQYERLIFYILKSDKTDLLVVTYSNIPQQLLTFLTDLYEILKRRPYKKIIFIIQERDINEFKKFFWNEKCYSIIEDKTFTLNHLTDESQKTILKSVVAFQGKKINLNKLIDEKDDSLKELIDSEMLVKLIKKNEVTIGHELINLSDTKNYYIPRIFNYQAEIKAEIFKEKKVKYLLAISGIDEARLRRLVPEDHKISLVQEYLDKSNDLDKRNDIRYIILNNGQAADQFKQLCQHYPALNIHWLKSESDQLIWQQSQGSISGLHQFIEIDESHTKYYSETELSQTDQYKVMIISDTAGMGKTTVLTSLSLLFKQQDPDLWIVRIDLNNFTKELQEQKVNNSFKTRDIYKAITFLSNDILKLGTPLEQAIFKSYCQKMIVMFDGFDEISPDYRDIVIELVNVLRNSTIKQLWLTTRPNERDILEDKLQQLSYKLEPFSKTNQVNFITKFWQQASGLSEITQEHQKRLKDYAGALIDLLTKSIRYKDTELTGIPLQTKMLAEAFEKDFAKLFQANEAKPQLPEKLDLTDLYECFLKKKYDIQLEKSKLDISQPNVKAHSETEYSKFIEKHQHLALYTLFPEDKVEMLLCEKFYQEFSQEYPHLAKLNEDNKQLLFEDKKQKLLSFINNIKTSTVTTGIIDQIIEDKPHFIHRTFAEYLIGKFLVASLDNETIFEFVLQEILMKQAYQVTRAFLNDQLPESLQENTLARFGKQIERLWQSDKRNLYNKKSMTLLQVAAEEGAVKIIRFLLNSLKRHEKIQKSLVEATTTYYYENPTALHLAARGGYLDVIQCLVEHGKANVEATDKYCRTVLHWAVEKNKWDIAQWLMEHGKANVEATDNFGETVLHWAAKKYKWDVVQWLVEHGADVNVQDNYGRTVLQWSAQGNLDIVQWLIEHGKANVDATDNDGRTVLHCAARVNKWDVVQWLVEHGFDVNVQSVDGTTVLHWAARRNLLVIKWLMKHGKANVEATDNIGRTVVHWAAQTNKWDVVQWLVEHGKANVDVIDYMGRTVLHYAAKKNKWDVVQWLVEHGKANVDVIDDYGRTVLHWAAQGKLDVVQWLVEHGKANVEATDNDGRTVLHWAAQGNLNVVQWLVEHGKANVEATDNVGRTVLYWAAQGTLDVVQWLVEHGKVNVKATDKYGRTVLLWETRGNLDVVQWLVERGKVNVEATDNDGRTVLHWAAKDYKWNFVQWLVKHGKANVEATDNVGRTVLHLVARGNLDVVQWLVEHGKANVEATDNDGRTVLHWAAQGNLDVVQWLVEHRKANVEATDNVGRTVLYWAAQGTLDVVQWLVERGKVNVEATDNDGRTVLHWAAKDYKWNFVQWLVEHGKANVEATDNVGRTVLHYAAQMNKWDVVQWLVEYGADINATDIEGKTPLNLAEEGKHKKMTEYLKKKIVESVGQVSTESAAIADVITANGREDLADLLCETREN